MFGQDLSVGHEREHLQIIYKSDTKRKKTANSQQNIMNTTKNKLS